MSEYFRLPFMGNVVAVLAGYDVHCPRSWQIQANWINPGQVPSQSEVIHKLPSQAAPHKLHNYSDSGKRFLSVGQNRWIFINCFFQKAVYNPANPVIWCFLGQLLCKGRESLGKAYGNKTGIWHPFQAIFNLIHLKANYMYSWENIGSANITWSKLCDYIFMYAPHLPRGVSFNYIKDEAVLRFNLSRFMIKQAVPYDVRCEFFHCHTRRRFWCPQPSQVLF